MRRFIIPIFFTVVFASSGAWFVVNAQTWLMSPSAPPDNTTVRPIGGGGGDNLGIVDPHTATKVLHLNSAAAPGYRIYGIGGMSAEGALQIASDKMGLSFGAGNNFGFKAITNSNDSAYAGLYAWQTEGSPALVASSAGGFSAQLVGLTNVTNGVIVGNNLANSISLTRQSTEAKNNLYWGNLLLCNPRLPDCGWIPAGASGDGLGNHIATQTLNMDGHSIYNIGASGVDPAIAAVGTLASSTIDSRSVAHHGVYAESSGDSTTAGLYANSTGNGPALLGTSVSGLGGRSYGPLELLDHTASGVSAQIQLGPTAVNRLNVAALAGAPTTNLYWGDKLLCDVSKPNCGWAQGAGSPGYWLDNAKGIHYPDLSGPNASKGILLGRTADSSVNTRLDIGHSYLAGEPSSRYNIASVGLGGAIAQDVVVRGTIAYIATNTGLRIVDVTRDNTPKLLGNLALSASAWGIAIGGRYAYIATTAGLKIVDIIDPAAPTLKGSYTINTINNVVPYTTDVEIAGHYAFVSYALAAGTGGLQVIDVADPSTPIGETITTTNIVDSRNLALQGNDLVLADFVNGLKLYHVTDLIAGNNAAPVFSQPGNFQSVAIRGNAIYVAGSTISIYDRTTGSLQGQWAGLFTKGSYGLQVTDDYAYVINGGLRIFNTDNLSAIQEITSNNPYVAGDEGRMAVVGRMIYLADRSSQLAIKNNQGLLVGAARVNSGVFDAMSVLTNMSTAGTVTVNSLDVGTQGIKVDGSITTSSNGLVLQGVKLNETRLQAIISKCRSVSALCP
jgi:hypothetical protein